MSARIRTTLAALAALLLLTTPVSAANAYSAAEYANTSIVFDSLVLRPLGLATFFFGSSLFVAALPLVAITRPHEIAVPFRALVIRPARFVWVDSLGGH